TEARLEKLADEMLRDIDKDTVNWDPNFDETRKEPRVLPSRFPNLLVNGSNGIAVGMATNIPPHNLTEVINACVAVLDDPEITMADMMEHISGPDFPTGGIIMGRSGIRAAYATGRGKVVVRARTEFEIFNHDRTRIIVTELPYQVNKSELVRKIAEQVRDKKLDGISDLRDESDRIGMRIVIELKKDANPQVVLNNLFKQTALQSSFGIILLALVDDQKQPKILSLRQIIDEYLTFQMEVLTRRTRYDLRKARERAHLLEGLLIAQDNIDEVIRIIRSRYDDAKEALMARFGLDDIQAQAILDMRLKALQGLDREKLQNEYDELMERIRYFEELLADPVKLQGVLREELIAIRDKFGDKRRTEIQEIEDEIDIEDLIEEETCAFTLSNQGYIKRMSVDTYRTQGRGGRGVSAQNLKEEDYVKSLNIASTHDHMLFFTDKGKVHHRKGYQIPEAGRTARGTAIVNVLPLEPGENVTAMVITREFNENEFLMMCTRKGTVKRIPFIALSTRRKGGIRAITLEEGDQLINVIRTMGNDLCVLATNQGMAICFNENDVRPMGRDAAGVRGITLSEGDFVVGAERYEEGKTLLTITENGFGKRTELPEYLRTGPDGEKIPQGRGGKGLKNYNITPKTGAVAGCRVVGESDDIMVIENGGVIIRTPVSNINIYKRDVQGVIVMRIEEGNKVVSIERVEKIEENAQ
ncbi:MAG: DNA gyrase subunit A, partial [Oscillospiraceae bacterium]|nr:DNA gyrase subunit A [Oscillospiraceae bacterium]